METTWKNVSQWAKDGLSLWQDSYLQVYTISLLLSLKLVSRNPTPKNRFKLFDLWSEHPEFFPTMEKVFSTVVKVSPTFQHVSEVNPTESWVEDAKWEEKRWMRRRIMETLTCLLVKAVQSSITATWIQQSPFKTKGQSSMLTWVINALYFSSKQDSFFY